jgi:hypothetical protein
VAELSKIFVKYSCGCKGIRLDQQVPEGEPLAGMDLMICIDPCDLGQGDHSGPYFYVRAQDLDHKRQLSEKVNEDDEPRAFMYLTIEEADDLLVKIKTAVADGIKFREIRDLLDLDK